MPARRPVRTARLAVEECASLARREMFAHRGYVIADLGNGISQLRFSASKLLAPVLQLQGIFLEDPTWIQWLEIAQVIRHAASSESAAGPL
jgi:hypothetical protein